MTDVDSTVMVPNPYKAALTGAADQARPVAAECATALDGVVSAFKGNAWTGGTSDAFGGALAKADRDAENAGQDCVDALERAAAREPAKVEANAWQTHWHNLMGF